MTLQEKGGREYDPPHENGLSIPGAGGLLRFRLCLEEAIGTGGIATFERRLWVAAGSDACRAAPVTDSPAIGPPPGLPYGRAAKLWPEPRGPVRCPRPMGPAFPGAPCRHRPTKRWLFRLRPPRNFRQFAWMKKRPCPASRLVNGPKDSDDAPARSLRRLTLAPSPRPPLAEQLADLVPRRHELFQLVRLGEQTLHPTTPIWHRWDLVGYLLPIGHVAQFVERKPQGNIGLVFADRFHRRCDAQTTRADLLQVDSVAGNSNDR